MQLETARFGTVEVPEDRILSFPEGLPGFPEATRFVMLEVPETDVFFWLQAIDDPDLAFLSAVPWPFFPDYEPVLPDDDQELLAIEDPQQALVLCLLTVQRDEGMFTANLLGPLVVNERTRTGRQVVLVDSEYPLRAPLVADAA